MSREIGKLFLARVNALRERLKLGLGLLDPAGHFTDLSSKLRHLGIVSCHHGLQFVVLGAQKFLEVTVHFLDLREAPLPGHLVSL